MMGSGGEGVLHERTLGKRMPQGASRHYYRHERCRHHGKLNRALTPLAP